MPAWFAYALIALAALAAGFVAYYLFAGGEEEDEGDDTLMITAADGTQDPLATTTEEYKTARKSRMIALKESLERSLDSREGTAQASAKDRMTMPWFLLVGADGSGKKTILANTGLPLPWGPPIEVDSHRKDAGKWWLFNQAVVLEAPAAAPGTTPGTTTLPPGQTVADSSVGWNTLLHMLRRERPDSPLNGIIVTISCADLLSARNNPDRMEEQADRIRNFLEKTRSFLGVRLPLHVLVTKCDTLPGFRSFVEALPQSRRNDIFGWANPNDPESKFEPAWVDTGFTALQQELSNLRDEVLAAPEHIRDSVGVFVFDSEFADLQETLKSFVARLMTIGERRPSLFFRGFYCTGDALDPSPAGANAETTMAEAKPRQTTRLSAEIAGEAHNLVFLKALFEDKIFREAGLARPAASFRLARDRRVVLAQAAAILIAIVGGAGLWTALNGVRREDTYRPGLRENAEALTRVLSGVAIDLDELRRGDRLGEGSSLSRRTRDAAVIELVGQMREVPSMRVRSAFIPTSWFSPLPDEIRQSMMAGLQNIVFPVTRQRLIERADRLLTPRSAGDTLVSDELDASDPRSLITYLNDVRTLSRNIARYNSLAGSESGNVSELSGLLDYLFGERIAGDTTIANEDFEEALRFAQGEKIRVPASMAASVVGRAVAMVASVAADASRQLAPRTTPAAERAIRPEDDLEALKGLAAIVELLDARKGVVALVPDSVILGTKLTRAVHDSIATQLELAAARIAPRDTIAPDSSARRLRNVISTVYAFRVMEPIEHRRIASDIRPTERLRWDVGKLELALAFRGEFLQAVVAVQEGFPGQAPERLRRALEVQLRSRAIDVAASAQRFTSIAAPPMDPVVEIRTSGLNLEQAAPRIVRLSILLDSLKATAEGQRLVAAGARQAEHALATAQALFDRQRYLAPQTARIAAWQGVLPIAFAALGVTDSLRFGSELLAHETAIRTLAHDVVHSIRYLRMPAVGDSLLRLPRLLSEWETITTAVGKYERGDATSTMGMLHRYLRESMSMNDPAVCASAAAEADTIKPSTDIFVIRRRQYRAALVARCGANGTADAVAAYQRLRTLFNARLAGRYPFVDSTTARTLEAEPSAVREILRQYDAFAVTADVALRSDPTLTQTGKLAQAFLDQLAQVREFLVPYAEVGASRNAPEYSLLIGPGSTTLPDSVPAQLTVKVGARELVLDESQQEQGWRYGDALSVVVTPLDTSKARTVFAATGGWTALRLAQQPTTFTTLKFFHPDTKQELALPVFPAQAPELVVLRPRPAPVVAGGPAIRR